MQEQTRHSKAQQLHLPVPCWEQVASSGQQVAGMGAKQSQVCITQQGKEGTLHRDSAVLLRAQGCMG